MNPLEFTSQVNNSGTRIHTLIHMPMPALISISFAFAFALAIPLQGEHMPWRLALCSVKS